MTTHGERKVGIFLPLPIRHPHDAFPEDGVWGQGKAAGFQHGRRLCCLSGRAISRQVARPGLRIAANIAKLAELFRSRSPINKDSPVDTRNSGAAHNTDSVSSFRRRHASWPGIVAMLQTRTPCCRRGLQSLSTRTIHRFAPQRVFRCRR
jgi:hypothetical protein